LASLKKNVAANMLGQLYVAAIGIIMVPVYVRYMGIEAYGLISFFVALQTWFALLDMGVSPTLIRELSRYRAGAVSQEAAWRFIRNAEWLFLTVGCVSAVVLTLTSGWIAGHWLQLTEISVSEASHCVAMMGVMIGGRWLTGLYRSGLIGMDRLLRVNLLTVLLATLRSVGVVAVLAWLSTRCEVFFAYQVVIAVLEFSLCCVLFYRGLPGGTQSVLRPDLNFLPVFRFAGAMAGLTLAWGIIGQVDRLVLSHYLDLKAYGSYAIALTAASGVTLLTNPLIQALQPRLVFLASSDGAEALANLYRSGTQMLMCVLVVVAGGAVFFGKTLLWVWTGHRALAQQEAMILALYAAGNALFALSSLVFQLQYARGELRRHMIGSFIFSIIWVPAAVILSVRYGAAGAAWSWFLGNLAFFTGWMLETQRRMLPGITWSWVTQDVLRGPLVCLPIYALLASCVSPESGRFASALLACGAASLITLIGIWVSPRLRVQAAAYFSGVLCSGRSA
jgi:O-antigen/teichoic acid export membrane protein